MDAIKNTAENRMARKKVRAGRNGKQNHKDLVAIEDRSDAPTPVGVSVKKRDKYNWKPLGAEGMFMSIPKHELMIDRTYQRSLVSTGRVVDIARNWDWLLCGALLVAMRPDGTLVIVDGQHRGVAASYRDDIYELPCMVYDLDGVSDEARMFVDANTKSKTVGAFDKHRANLRAGEPIAKEAERIIRSVGYEFSNNHGGRHTTKAVARIEHMVAKNAELAEKVVELAAAAYDGEPLSVRILMALEWIGARDSELFTATHRNRLIDAGHDGLESAMNRHKLIADKGGQRVYAAAVLKVLNKGRRSNTLCDDEI